MSTQQEKEDAFKAKKIGTVLNALMQIRLLMVQFGILEWGGCGDCGSPWVNFSKESNLSVTDVNISKTPQKMRADESFFVPASLQYLER